MNMQRELSGPMALSYRGEPMRTGAIDRERLMEREKERERERERVLQRSREQVAGRRHSSTAQLSGSLSETGSSRELRLSYAREPRTTQTIVEATPMETTPAQYEDVIRWSVDKVQKWLVHHGMAKHAATFLRNEVDGATLVSLTPADLVDELRIPGLRERRNLLALIRSVAGPPLPLSAGGLSAGVPSDLPELLERESSIIQSFIQMEVRRSFAALHHDVTKLASTVEVLQQQLDRVAAHVVPPESKPRRLVA
ncbi:hypothetical protein DIPPA_04428 [Diplonema papillatum]|nr:hypothetical protein DIPPA_04428 [Diplonema papillatum]